MEFVTKISVIFHNSGVLICVCASTDACVHIMWRGVLVFHSGSPMALSLADTSYGCSVGAAGSPYMPGSGL